MWRPMAAVALLWAFCGETAFGAPVAAFPAIPEDQLLKALAPDYRGGMVLARIITVTPAADKDGVISGTLEADARDVISGTMKPGPIHLHYRRHVIAPEQPTAWDAVEVRPRAEFGALLTEEDPQGPTYRADLVFPLDELGCHNVRDFRVMAEMLKITDKARQGGEISALQDWRLRAMLPEHQASLIRQMGRYGSAGLYGRAGVMFRDTQLSVEARKAAAAVMAKWWPDLFPVLSDYVIRTLLAGLKDPSPVIRGAVVQGLGRIAATADAETGQFHVYPDVIAAIAALAKSEKDPAVRKEATIALARAQAEVAKLKDAMRKAQQ